MKPSNDDQLLSKHELMETRGGYIPISPSLLIPFITSYGDEICNSIKDAYSSFIAGLRGQPEP